MGGPISTSGRVEAGSAEHNSLTNRAPKNFATGPGVLVYKAPINSGTYFLNAVYRPDPSYVKRWSVQVSPAHIPNGINVLQNGDFELGPSGWTLGRGARLATDGSLDATAPDPFRARVRYIGAGASEFIETRVHVPPAVANPYLAFKSSATGTPNLGLKVSVLPQGQVNSAMKGRKIGRCSASLIETCKLHRINPQAYLVDVLTKLVNNWPNRRLGELLPWICTPEAF